MQNLETDSYHWKELLVIPLKNESVYSWWSRQAEVFLVNSFEFLNCEKEFWHDHNKLGFDFPLNRIEKLGIYTFSTNLIKLLVLSGLMENQYLYHK